MINYNLTKVKTPRSVAVLSSSQYQSSHLCPTFSPYKDKFGGCCWWLLEDEGVSKKTSQIVSQLQLSAAAEFQTRRSAASDRHSFSVLRHRVFAVRGNLKFCPTYVTGCIKNSASSVYSWVVCRRVNTVIWQFIFERARTKYVKIPPRARLLPLGAQNIPAAANFSRQGY